MVQKKKVGLLIEQVPYELQTVAGHVVQAPPSQGLSMHFGEGGVQGDMFCGIGPQL